jgi:hypothetical protein
MSVEFERKVKSCHFLFLLFCLDALGHVFSALSRPRATFALYYPLAGRKVINEDNFLKHERSSLSRLLLNEESRGSSGSIVSDYGLDDRGSIPSRGKGFFF